MGWGYSHLLAIRVSAAGEGMVFKPFGLAKTDSLNRSLRS